MMHVLHSTEVYCSRAYCNVMHCMAAGGWVGKLLWWGWKVATASVTNIIKASTLSLLPATFCTSFPHSNSTTNYSFYTYSQFPIQAKLSPDFIVWQFSSELIGSYAIDRALPLSECALHSKLVALSSPALHWALSAPCTAPEAYCRVSQGSSCRVTRTLFRINLTLTAAQ